MADYNAPVTTAQMDEVFQYTVLFNRNQMLSAAEKRQARKNLGIDDVGLTIKGQFATVTALAEQVNTPNVGDAYAIGTAVPYEIYIWMGLSWVNFGNIYGVKGENGKDGKDGTGATLIRNTSVAVSAFVADSTHPAYPYRAAIPIADISAEMVAEVTFSVADATSGKYAPINSTYAGGLYIYAVEKPNSTLSIPTIVFWRDE